MTPTDICNMALSRLGEPRISDIDENTPRAISCRAHFDVVRDSLLRSHPWNFAVSRALLTQSATAPVFGFDFAYALPSDFLRLMTLNGIQADMCVSDFTLESGQLLTYADEAKITYVRRVIDPTAYDPIFLEVLAFRLASAVAMDVTSDIERRNSMEQLAALRLAAATFTDSGENRARIAPTTQGLTFRMRGLPDQFINPPFPPFEP
jgi:hypothetical protein